MDRNTAPGWTTGLDDLPLAIQGYRGSYERGALIETIAAITEQHEATLQVLDPAAIYGREHLEAAAAKALRSQRQGRAIAEDLGVEIACYAAGTDQISRALEQVGLPASGDTLVAVAIGPDADQALAALSAEAGLTPDDAVIHRPVGALEKLGVTEAARRAVPEERWSRLAVEQVALLDARR